MQLSLVNALHYGGEVLLDALPGVLVRLRQSRMP